VFSLLQMVNVAPRHVWIPQPTLMVAFVGLDGDVQSLSENLQMEVNNKLNRALGFEVVPKEGINEVSRLRRISPQALASLTSHVLYQNRGKFYVQPLIVGLKERTGVPFLCGMDSIGAQSLSTSFACSGAASSSLYGTAEALWKPGLEAEELVEACGKAFQSALERDCLSGYGALVYLITKEGIVEYDLASRND
jgi:20S proteasome subunit beta 3